MKHSILIVSLFIIFSCVTNSQKKYFNSVQSKNILNNDDNLYYQIKLKKNSELTYPFSFSNYSEKEKIEMISELLSYEGDERICIYPISNYNSKLSQFYKGNKKKYSLQLEALFIINQIFFEPPFDYSPYPILSNIDYKNEETIKGELIYKAYNEYKKWFNRLKKNGIKKSLEIKDYPLNDKEVTWMYGFIGKGTY